MALLGAALAPVIHCSNWTNRSIYFLLIKLEAGRTTLQDETGRTAFSYRGARRIGQIEMGTVLEGQNRELLESEDWLVAVLRPGYSFKLSGFKIIRLCGGQIVWQYAAAEFSSLSLVL
jgi:hypothetical protein